MQIEFPSLDRRRVRRPGSVRRAVLFAALVCGLVAMLYPLAWMVASSLKPQDQIFTDPTPLVRQFTLQNYLIGWSGLGTPFSRFILNSVIVALGAVVGNTVSCSLAAFAFARLKFKLRRVWFGIMMLSIMLPFQVTVVPQYILFSAFGWINTYLPLIVPRFLATDAFFIFLMVQFIRSIPRDLDDAAAVDGASPAHIYWFIVLPLMTPALITTAIFSFIFSWNDFFSALLYLNNPDWYTIPVALQQFLDAQGTSSWGPMLAMTTLSIIPVLVVFSVFQRRLTEGISTTGLKL